MALSRQREHELVMELAEAAVSEAEILERELEARRALEAVRRELQKVRHGIRVVLEELRTGRRADPLIEYAERRAEERGDTADEHQRGVTALPAGDERFRSAVAADVGLEDERGYVEWTTSDLNEELERACFRVVPGYASGAVAGSVWIDLRRGGCDDAKIVEVLRAIWPDGAHYERGGTTGNIGRTVAGGATPRFWVGRRRSADHNPTLAGLALADRVRTVLGLPRVGAVEVREEGGDGDG